MVLTNICVLLERVVRSNAHSRSNQSRIKKSLVTTWALMETKGSWKNGSDMLSPFLENTPQYGV